MEVQALVVDDEQLARDELCYLLGQIDGVEIAGQAANGVEAIRLIDAQDPDLVFLDIQMPGLTGFEVARRLVEQGVRTQIVFVTAFDRHAIEAFEVNAVDYLLKPVESVRLARTVERVRQRLTMGRQAAVGNEELGRLVKLVAGRPRRERVAVRVGERLLLVHTDDIVHASLADDVITIVTTSFAGTSNHRTLDELQAHLDPDVFWRVHRSHLVNINKIKEIVPWFSRNYILKMKDTKTTEIPVSRSQTKRLREYLNL